MSWIRIGARHCVLAAIVGLTGFARVSTADTVVSAFVATCATVTTQACDTLTGNPGVKINSIDFFGSVAVGDSNSTGGSGNAQIDWFQKHFGLLASGSTNTTASDNALHMGGALTSGDFLDTLTVPVQLPLGLNLGNTGVMQLPYHLHGTIHISAPAFETAFVSFNWQYGFGPSGMGVSFGRRNLARQEV